MKRKIVYPALKAVSFVLLKLLRLIQPFSMKFWGTRFWKNVSWIVMRIDRWITAIDWYVTTEERAAQLFAKASYEAERTEWVAMDESDFDGSINEMFKRNDPAEMQQFFNKIKPLRK